MDPERSVIRYRGRHMLGLGVVHATFRTAGEIRVADPLTSSTVTVAVDPASFSSNSAKRDADVRGGRLLDVERYPEITFVSDGLRQDGERWLLVGEATAHDTSVPVEVVVDRVAVDRQDVRAHGKVEHLDRRAFGVTGGRGLVSRYLDLDLDVVATRS
jgi:polyisoprenoid-binding protein YceI